VSFETALDQWRAGERRLAEAPPREQPALQRVLDALVAARVAPRAPWSWDARVADAAFARYVRGAVDFAGGRRLDPPD
jgi:hypothetical protein